MKIRVFISISGSIIFKVCKAGKKLRDRSGFLHARNGYGTSASIEISGLSRSINFHKVSQCKSISFIFSLLLINSITTIYFRTDNFIHILLYFSSTFIYVKERNSYEASYRYFILWFSHSRFRTPKHLCNFFLSVRCGNRGLPVVIPYFSDLNCIANYIKLFDGILFCGGTCLHRFYTMKNLARIGEHTDYKTDTFHFTFMKEADSVHVSLSLVSTWYAGTKSGTWRNHLSRPLPSA